MGGNTLGTCRYFKLKLKDCDIKLNYWNKQFKSTDYANLLIPERKGIKSENKSLSTIVNSKSNNSLGNTLDSKVGGGTTFSNEISDAMRDVNYYNKCARIEAED